jgi:hypothetical protein
LDRPRRNKERGGIPSLLDGLFFRSWHKVSTSHGSTRNCFGRGIEKQEEKERGFDGSDISLWLPTDSIKLGRFMNFRCVCSHQVYLLSIGQKRAVPMNALHPVRFLFTV